MQSPNDDGSQLGDCGVNNAEKSPCHGHSNVHSHNQTTDTDITAAVASDASPAMCRMVSAEVDPGTVAALPAAPGADLVVASHSGTEKSTAAANTKASASNNPPAKTPTTQAPDNQDSDKQAFNEHAPPSKARAEQPAPPHAPIAKSPPEQAPQLHASAEQAPPAHAPVAQPPHGNPPAPAPNLLGLPSMALSSSRRIRKAFRCPLANCKKRFKRRSSLAVHINMHMLNGEAKLSDFLGRVIAHNRDEDA